MHVEKCIGRNRNLFLNEYYSFRDFVSSNIKSKINKRNSTKNQSIKISYKKMPKSCIAEGFRSLLSNYFIVVASTHNLLPFFNFLRYTSDTYTGCVDRSSVAEPRAAALTMSATGVLRCPTTNHRRLSTQFLFEPLERVRTNRRCACACVHHLELYYRECDCVPVSIGLPTIGHQDLFDRFELRK